MSQNQIQTPWFKWSLENGIIHGVCSINAEIDLNAAKQIAEARVKLCNGTSYACLSDIRKIKSVTKEARAYFAEEGSALLTASAIVTDSVFTRALAEAFVFINKPPVPTAYFGSVREAEEWLQHYSKG